MENARMPFVEIARKLGVSETAVRKRLQKLEELGIIKRYTIEVDPRKIGFNIVALIGIDTTPEAYVKVIDTLKNDDRIVKMYSSSGDHMLLLEVWFRNSEEMTRFVKCLNNIEGVTRVCPAIIIERLK